MEPQPIHGQYGIHSESQAPQAGPAAGWRDGRVVMSRFPDNVLELLRPGSFVRLRNQPRDLPPFQVIHCRGGRCWVRQQSWGSTVQWEVAHRQLTAVATDHARRSLVAGAVDQAAHRA
jgi:hypothetical protein